MGIKFFSGDGQIFIHHEKNTRAKRLHDMRHTGRPNSRRTICVLSKTAKRSLKPHHWEHACYQKWEHKMFTEYTKEFKRWKLKNNFWEQHMLVFWITIRAEAFFGKTSHIVIKKKKILFLLGKFEPLPSKSCSIESLTGSTVFNPHSKD